MVPDISTLNINETQPKVGKDAQIVIVGGGGTMGSSTALHLLRRGYTNVRILDKWPSPSADSAGNDLNKVSRAKRTFAEGLTRADCGLGRDWGLGRSERCRLGYVEERPGLPAALARERQGEKVGELLAKLADPASWIRRYRPGQKMRSEPSTTRS